MNNATNQNRPDAAGYYHVIELTLCVVISVVLLPINGFVIRALCRPSMIRRPVNWLFIYLAVWDIVGLLIQIAWNAVEYFGNDSHRTSCTDFDLTLRVVEKLTECIPAYITAAIAILRAIAIRGSSRHKKTKPKKLTIIIVCLATVVLSALACPSLVAVNCLFPGTETCSTSLNPLYGAAEITHAAIQLIFINGTVLVCYTYICIVLVYNHRLMSRCAVYAKNQPHRRTFIVLLVYTLVYTVMTAPSHINDLVIRDCFSGSEQVQYIVEDILDSIWQIGFAGLNPFMLYACNKDFRRSLSVMYKQFKTCDLVSYGNNHAQDDGADSDLDL